MLVAALVLALVVLVLDHCRWRRAPAPRLHNRSHRRKLRCKHGRGVLRHRYTHLPRRRIGIYFSRMRKKRRR